MGAIMLTTVSHGGAMYVLCSLLIAPWKLHLAWITQDLGRMDPACMVFLDRQALINLLLLLATVSSGLFPWGG